MSANLVPSGLVAIGAAACLLATISCSEPQQSPVPSPVAHARSLSTDRNVVFNLAHSLAAAHTVNRRCVAPGDPGQSAVLGQGWAQAEVHGSSGERFRWVIQQEATARLDLLDTNFDTFFIRCWPFRWDEAPEQTVTVTINDTVLGTIKLSRRLRTYELTMPQAVLLPGRNQVRLSFAHAVAPREHVPGHKDPRTLAAAVVAFGVGEDRDATFDPKLAKDFLK